MCGMRPKGEQDDELLRLARDEARLLVTDDRDFGELVYRQRLNAAGIILTRMHRTTIADRLHRLAAVWPEIECRASGGFAVVSDTRVRVRPLS